MVEQVFMNISAKQADIRANGNLVILYTDFSSGSINWSVMELDNNGQALSNHILPFSTSDYVEGNDIKVLPSNEIMVHGYGQFNFTTGSSLVYRKLPADIDSLNNCPATLSSISTSQSFLAVSSISPNYNAQAFNDFTIINANPSQQTDQFNGEPILRYKPGWILF